MKNNNQLIANFMEMTPHIKTPPALYLVNENVIQVEQIPFHTSWDMLMLVIQKIGNMLSENVTEVTLAEQIILHKFPPEINLFSSIDIVYNTVVECIIELNKLKN